MWERRLAANWTSWEGELSRRDVASKCRGGSPDDDPTGIPARAFEVYDVDVSGVGDTVATVAAALAGVDVVVSYGGSVELVDLIEGHSNVSVNLTPSSQTSEVMA